MPYEAIRQAVPTRIPVYVFRDTHFSAAGDAVVAAAPLDVVVSVYGGGGLKEEEGLATAFDGAAFFRNDETGQCFLGVWGARNASRFRSALRRSGARIEIVRDHPPARLTWFRSNGKQTESAGCRLAKKARYCP